MGRLAVLAVLLLAMSFPSLADDSASPTVQDITVRGNIIGGNLSGGNASSATATPSQATTLRIFGVKLNEIVSIADFGALPGTQATCTVTTNSSSTTLTVSGCTFTSAVCHSGSGCTGATDNLITIDGAGSTSTTTYAGTVTGYTSGTQVTLSAMPGQTLAAVSESVSWGPDNSAAIVSADNAAVAAGGFGRIYVPAGVWLTSGQMTLNPGAKQSMIYGAGIDNSVIVAGAAMTQLLFEGTSFVRGGEVSDVSFDGNRLTTNVAFLSCAERNLIHNANFKNAAPLGTNIILGDGVTSGCNSSSLIDVQAQNDATRYAGGTDLPLNLAIVNETDSWWTNFFGNAASLTGITIASTAANTHMVAPHLFGSGVGYNPATTYQVNASAFLEQVNVDGVKTLGVDINAGNVTLTDGTLILPENASTVVGLKIEASRNNVQVTGWNASDALSVAANRLIVSTPIAAHVFAFGNPGANDYNSLPVYPNGDTGSIAVGGGTFAAATATSGSTGFGTNCLEFATSLTSDSCFGRDAGQNATGNNNFFAGAFTGINFSSGNFESIGGEGNAQNGASRITGDDVTIWGAVNANLLAGASTQTGMFGDHLGATCTLTTDVWLFGHSIDCPAGTTSHWINLDKAYIASTVAPTISSGFGSGASVTAGTTSKAFTIGVGTGGTANTGVIAFATAAPTGWICKVTDVTNVGSFVTESVTTSSTSVTLTNYSRTTGSLIAWTASDFLTVTCDGY